MNNGELIYCDGKPGGDISVRRSFASSGPIGVFDSGYGGLTVLKEIRRLLPQYSYLYLGDNARAPYGTRSFECVYQFTRQAVEHLFACGCPLVILACNTASAKALRNIQQNDLPFMDDPTRRVLGVIRPTVEKTGELTVSRHVGVLGTPGTVASRSYELELAKLNPDIHVTQHACPMWCPLVENHEASGPGADYFVKKEIDALFKADSEIDTVILACTHYPLLLDKIRLYMPQGVRTVVQGSIVAESLADYLLRHPEMDRRLLRGASVDYLTTEHPDKFSDLGSLFLSEPVSARHIDLN